jgi:hypothetical protein
MECTHSLVFYLFFFRGFYTSSFSLHSQHSQGEQRAAHFRSLSPAHPQSQSTSPQTGLGILMNGNVGGAPGPFPSAPTLLAPNPPLLSPGGLPTNYAHLPPDQQKRIQDDLADREQQASALAAAGMVAESVNLTRPAVIGQVLQAPPALVGMPPPSCPPHTEGGHVAMEGINWNDLGGNVDDMDMDFAAMFDPEQEQAYMQLADGSLTPVPTLQPLAQAPPIKTEEHGTPNPLNATSS